PAQAVPVQETPAGVDETVPCPLPDRLTVTVCGLGLPVPISVTTVLPPGVAVNVSVAAMSPEITGWKATVMEQVAPGARWPPAQVSAVMRNWARPTPPSAVEIAPEGWNSAL